MRRPCDFCGKSFQVDASRRNWQHVKICSDECRLGVAAAARRAKYKPKKPQRKNCLQCGGSFLPATFIGARQKYCSRSCFLERKATEAHDRWSDAVRKKVCVHCGVDYIPKKFGGGKQIYCGKKCQVSAIFARHGHKSARTSKYYREFHAVKPVILERDNKTCVICGSTSKPHVHHWDNSGRTPECNNSQDNLAVLCSSCHREIHNLTLAKVNGKWVLQGRILKKLGVREPVPIAA